MISGIVSEAFSVGVEFTFLALYLSHSFKNRLNFLSYIVVGNLHRVISFTFVPFFLYNAHRQIRWVKCLGYKLRASVLFVKLLRSFIKLVRRLPNKSNLVQIIVFESIVVLKCGVTSLRNLWFFFWFKENRVLSWHIKPTIRMSNGSHFVHPIFMVSWVYDASF